MSTSNNTERPDVSFWALYLKKYLSDEGNPNALNDEFINNRADSAEAEFERQRLDGRSVDQAQECAMRVLMEGLD